LLLSRNNKNNLPAKPLISETPLKNDLRGKVALVTGAGSGIGKPAVRLLAENGVVEFPEGEVPLIEGMAGRPEQVAQLVLFLASDASDLITGTEIWIDGGESLLRG
jgi:NAD(P)-dependent dehydrogenase (short-subunit alcohol dehydrogenase family)